MVFVKIFLWGFALVCAFSGILIVYISIMNSYRSWRSLAWPSVPGVIDESAVEIDEDAEGTTYSFRIHYCYAVDNIQYRGRRFFFGELVTAGPLARFRAIAERYPAGKSVLIHYDPNNPRWAVVEPGLHWDVLVFLAFGLFVLFVVMQWIVPLAISPS